MNTLNRWSQVLATLALVLLGSGGAVLASETHAGSLDRRPAIDGAQGTAGGHASEEAVQRLKEQGRYDSLVAAVEATRYRVSERTATGTGPGTYEVANPAQRFSAAFTPGGVDMRPTGEATGWRLGMRLSAWGYGERLEPPGAALIAASGNRVEYRYPAGGAGALTEWYVNTAHGIEQGFTLARPPAAGPGIGPLALVVAVTGDLAPRLAPAGQAIQLASADGTAVLGYSGLRAWDATGRTLPSRLTVEAGQVRLRVDDAAAAYPVTVDPLVYSETKLDASDGVNFDQFGLSVAIGEDGDTVVVGERGATKAYVYVRSGTAWSEQAELANAGGGFGPSVAISGDTVVVGAYVYVRSGTAWSEQAKLAASDGAAFDEFGVSGRSPGTGHADGRRQHVR